MSSAYKRAVVCILCGTRLRRAEPHLCESGEPPERMSEDELIAELRSLRHANKGHIDKQEASVSVTTNPDAATGTATRNAELEAELVTQVEAAITSPRRPLLESIFGARSDDEVTASTTVYFLEWSSYRCRCEHVFVDGEVVYRRRESKFPSSGWTLSAICDTCVQGWHPSWRENRREPVPCASGCGVLVSHWYAWQETTTCSRRCSERVAGARKRVQRVEHSCGVCGETFLPKRADARYCSSPCRQDAYRRRKGGAPGGGVR